MRHYLLVSIDHQMALVELLAIEIQETLERSRFGELRILSEGILIVLIEVSYDKDDKSIRVQATYI